MSTPNGGQGIARSRWPRLARLTRLVEMAALAGLLLSCSATNRQTRPAPPTADSRLLGQALPAFRRPTVAGSSFDIASSTGRIVVVDFFAAYCAPCQRNLPALVRLHKQRPELVVVAISLDENQTVAQAQARAFGMNFPVVHDAGRTLAGRFRVSELPASFVADAQGRIRWVGGPGHAPDALPLAVDALLRGIP